MVVEVVAVAVAAFVLAALLTRAMLTLARSHDLIDVPNERSSHHAPTPRGGGVAIVLASIAGCVALAMLGYLQTQLLIAVAGGGLMVAVCGFIDDRYQLSARVRLLAHFGAACWALIWLGGLPALRIADEMYSLGPFGYLLGAFGIVWTINLFNFMDGIDGIAASEAAFIAASGAALALWFVSSSGVPWAALLFAAACCGFLLLNWPPARIFMGDVGSGYLGYVVAVLAVAAARESPVALFVWAILGGAFLVDATTTLARRGIRGERLHQAHRSHAYQHLARRWRSHERVVVAMLILNVAWLLPCAAFAVRYPAFAAATVVVALLPLVVMAVVAGAGRADS